MTQSVKPNADDVYWMSRALKLAQKGQYSTSPNPRVGCVIVKDGVCVGEGWHQRAGTAHAEIHALKAAGEQAKGACAYVTLEPCSHQGRTGPCANALKDAGIARVVGAMTDPNPSVQGQGFERLRAAGIEVIDQCLREQACELNQGFIKRMQTGLPWVRVKLAMSLDGRTAMQSGESQWITGNPARQDVQRLRAQSCAIITGSESVLIDNPSMTLRPQETGLPEDTLFKAPLRVLIDGQGRVPATAKLFSQAGDLLIASKASALSSVARDDALGALYHWHDTSETAHVNLTALLHHLCASHQINDVLVESGAQLAGAFIRAGLADELIVYCAPTLLGSDARPLVNLPLCHMDEQIRWCWHDVRQIGDDVRLTLRPEPES